MATSHGPCKPLLLSLPCRYGTAIKGIKWHRGIDGSHRRIISSDASVIKIWDPATVCVRVHACMHVCVACVRAFLCSVRARVHVCVA